MQVWLRGNQRFVPIFTIDSQTRPGGRQQNYSVFSYANWTRSFYTLQGFSAAPQSEGQPIFFPKWRYDIKANWKIAPSGRFVLGAGFTQFDYGKPGHGQIFNLGSLFYAKKLIVEGNLYVNRNQPGSLWSTSGSVSVQHGREGSYWIGTVVGGGRELYRYVGPNEFDARFDSISVTAFYRKWITRKFGFVLSSDYQSKITAYRRVGLATRLFFEF